MHIREGYNICHGSVARKNEVGIITAEAVDIPMNTDQLIRVRRALIKEQISNVTANKCYRLVVRLRQRRIPDTAGPSDK